MSQIYGGIEAGGTKFLCAVGSRPEEILAQTQFLTEDPGETIQRAIEFFHQQAERLGPLEAVGISSFGPLDPDPRSATFGYITTTPKPGWANTDFAGRVHRALNIPVGFDTDVNGAALGEARWGAAKGVEDFIYLTIGTGIGGGGMVNGKLLHGLVHPEMGHLLIPHDRELDPFPGTCPFHGDCLEGLASGPSIESRWGQPPKNLPQDHTAWSLEANYLAFGVANIIVTLSPKRVILGGGVMKQSHLFPLLRTRIQEILNGYIQAPLILNEIDRYIVPPGLGDRAGVLGAIALAKRAAGKE